MYIYIILYTNTKLQFSIYYYKLIIRCARIVRHTCIYTYDIFTNQKLYYLRGPD